MKSTLDWLGAIIPAINLLVLLGGGFWGLRVLSESVRQSLELLGEVVQMAHDDREQQTALAQRVTHIEEIAMAQGRELAEFIKRIDGDIYELKQFGSQGTHARLTGIEERLRRMEDVVIRTPAK